jgi:predicted Zn-dependent protease
MKSAAFVLAAAVLLATAAPAHAQLGGILNKAQKAKEQADKVADLNINDKEERQLGEQVSSNLVQKYGVYQDAAVTKYVTLVGTVLAQASTRPSLDWKFIVLDTDGVNAFAAPGGIIHITRGLLGLMKNESELADVLGHEITHVTDKHTVHYIQQQKGISIGTDAAGGGSTRDYIIAKMSEKAYHILLDGQYSQHDETDSDEVGVQLANKVGYDPHGLEETLKKIEARNAGREDRNGMFASHPAIKERISNVEKIIKDKKLTATATVQARYAKNITFDAKPVTEITTVVEGASGLAGDSKSSGNKDAKAEEPKKKGGLFGKVGLSSGQQAQNTQTTASAGSRGGVPDRDAKGGPNHTIVNAKVTPAEVAEFKKGIAA